MASAAADAAFFMGTDCAMNFGFSQPAWLFLLLTLPWVAWLGWKSPSGLDAWRRWSALGIRLAILIAMIFALAGFELRRRNDSVAAVFLLDHSESIPERYRSAMLGYVKTAADKKTLRDKAGLIVFGGDASIEAMPSDKLDAQKIYSVVNTHATDIASALRLAQAALPTDAQRRIVLISDGNENIGDATHEAESARANGITVDVLPVDEAKRGDLQIEKVVMPSILKKGEPFETKIHLLATDDAKAKLRVFRNGRYLGEQDVSVTRGRNVFAFPQTIEESGFHSYTVEVESPMDDIPQNNKGMAFTSVRGDPTALVIHADKSTAAPLDRALAETRIQARSAGIDGLPDDLAEMVNYDLIVLSNVNGGDLTEAQMKRLQSAVRDFGVGLAVIGGDDSFTAGGYRGTPLEDILPVSMDLSSKKVLPSGALALVVHATEFQDGNRWARDIALAALEALGPSDQMGIVLWNGNDQWLFPMQPVGNRQALGKLISGMNPGDMPSFINVMTMAHQGLAACKAHLKHMIVFSDGDPQPPTDAEVDAITADKITISTVMIGGHVAPDPMIRMAQRGLGRFHDVRAPNNLPQIFIKEAAVILKASIFEEPFRPKAAEPSEILRGLNVETIPELRGYVATTPKSRAETALVSHHGDPILAQWQYGLGRVVAFTSDAKPKWAINWVGWERWNSFWGQTAKWALRRIESSSYDANLQIQADKGRLLVDALDAQGKFLNHLDLQASVTLPQGKTLETRLRQTEPGHYETDFAAPEIGVYMANLRTMSNGVLTASQAVGASISYSAEFRDLKPNVHLLRKIADVSGGRILRPDDDVFGYQRVPAMRPTAMWNWLLAMAVLLFPLDVGIRRVMVDREQWLFFLRKLLAKIGWDRWQKRHPQADEAMSALLARKAKLRARIRPAVEQTVLPLAPLSETAPSPFADGTPPAASSTPVKTPPADAPPASPETPKPATGASDYTAKLLAAKRRARKDQDPSP
ncbi:MAG: VWA domain-containing protein [Verrucomicrobia bacterium]|nr:VWA domain-containing protein [Verrucomicrobiota bacterium]